MPKFREMEEGVLRAAAAMQAACGFAFDVGLDMGRLEKELASTKLTLKMENIWRVRAGQAAEDERDAHSKTRLESEQWKRLYDRAQKLLERSLKTGKP